MINEKLLFEQLGADVDIIVKETTVSTNTDGRNLTNDDIFRPTLIVADSQSGGRGRQGKSFLSPAGGLYMTVVLPADLPIEKATLATSCAAVAVCRGIEKTCGASCGIKWINDIYLNGRKLSGILTESVNDYSTMTSKYLIIGVGINVDSTPTVTDSSVRAISLAETGLSVEREALCENITREILKAFQTGFDFSVYKEEYRRRSVLFGGEISFTENGITRYAFAKDINDRGELIVICDGAETILSSGEISVRNNERLSPQ